MFLDEIGEMPWATGGTCACRRTESSSELVLPRNRCAGGGGHQYQLISAVEKGKFGKTILPPQYQCLLRFHRCVNEENIYLLLFRKFAADFSEK